jgi:CspA family cold shock protein
MPQVVQYRENQTAMPPAYLASSRRPRRHTSWKFVDLRPACVCAIGFAVTKRTGRYAMKGTVKWFNPTKGYGFISPESGGKDAFVHISSVEGAGLSTLNEGQIVEFELESGRDGKESAANLRVVE